MGRVDVERTQPAESSHVLGYGGEDFLLPATLPVAALEAMLGKGTGEQLLAFFQSVLGDQWPHFAEILNVADLVDLGKAIGTIYGTTLGESRVSGPSSESTSES